MRRLVHFASGLAALLTCARLAAAQAPGPEPGGPLAQVKDDKQLGETLAVITNDPSVPTDDPSVRPLAQALMIEGVKQLQARSYDQALANFLEAYAKFPSPKILLNIASTLRDMGRTADAANTYQRYLLDPATGAERVAEVKELLLKLDEQLTILTVRVFPRGSAISIDGGPFIPVGATLQTRVRPGIHLVRIRQAEAGNEVTVNGFEGENKEVAATLQMDVAPEPTPPTPTPTPTPTPPTPAPEQPEPPEQVQAWLSTGTQYSGDASGRSRRPRTGFGGAEISPITPAFDISEDNTAIIREDDRFGISSGVLGVVRVDGEGRGIAGGIGIAVSLGRFEGDLMYLRSNLHGGYVGARYRLLVGWLRPYVALGMPLFLYDEMQDNGMGTSKRVALGVRGAGGVELKINDHLSVHADLGYERFFAVEETLFYTNYFIPTVGVIGRL